VFSKGVLYVVATPIGNLEDITLRALKVLKSVQLVAAEDTRRSGNLLRHFQIETKILSVHAHNETGRVDRILATLERGESVALVTDAGTPAISDPGAILVARVRSAGFRVEPIPGANAVVAAVSASGVDTQGFTFLGFPPIRSKDRKIWFQHLVTAASERLVVFYEAPHKVQKTLAELDILVKRPIIVARELTKIHEEFVQGTPGELLERFKAPQGEFTVLIPPPGVAEKTIVSAENMADSDVMRIFGQITDSRRFSSKKEAAKAVGEQVGLTAKQVYTILERNK